MVYLASRITPVIATTGFASTAVPTINPEPIVEKNVKTGNVWRIHKLEIYLDCNYVEYKQFNT